MHWFFKSFLSGFWMELLDGFLAISCMDLWAFLQLSHSFCLLYLALKLLLYSPTSLLYFVQLLHDILKVSFLFVSSYLISSVLMEFDVVTLVILWNTFIESRGLLHHQVYLGLLEIWKQKFEFLFFCFCADKVFFRGFLFLWILIRNSEVVVRNG